ncbi:adenosylmethionine-8-amino-7-oxononanoate aminotransferase [Canicola haemoglobinophilus]|uniref:Adenosylmethionine-8-amino-7-oxononanoate aminotransferase n=1 Tax=Canicola haemoglobinophilus TaxID=733 RepID=A0AB38H852_9PAST|nr:adenosylmethionine-8-amino-7-oxononanoate aminotransferase [Canicola haemoglobinophilus]STO67584.1 adenosylmethionine-8-amino-7-oxononanoate aminotransferase [Canicola haemoglobinophilus]
MFGGFTHDPAAELAQRLVRLLPDGLDKIFFADSGSVAVEVVMKMAIQYQQAKGETQRTKFASIRSGYHGDTWHAMSVCDPIPLHSLIYNRYPLGDEIINRETERYLQQYLAEHFPDAQFEILSIID